MDFESAIETSARISRQLELRWFYDWDVTATTSSSTSSLASADKNNNSRGGLVRKRHHTMPFLIRNITAHRNSWDRSLRCHSSSRNDFDLNKFINMRLKETVPTTEKKQSKKKKKRLEALEESPHCKSNNTSSKGSKKVVMVASSSTSMNCKKSNGKHIILESNGTKLDMKKVMQGIPRELRNDETYMAERMKEAQIIQGCDGDASYVINAKNEVQNRIIEERKPRIKRQPGLSSSSIEPITINGSAVLHTSVALPLLNGSKPSSGIQQHQKTSSKKIPPAYFHYMCMQQQNNTPATIVEEIDERVCPLCSFDGKSNEGLLNHCKRYHRENFEAAIGEEGQFHVIVRMSSLDSLQLSAHQHDNFVFVQPRLLGIQHKSNTLAIPKLNNKKLTTLQANDRTSAAVPKRQYFHAHTNLPMTHDEWLQDSEEDIDETWLHKMNCELIDEFEDISSKEKQFMKIWNSYIKCDYVTADKAMPGKCHEFTLKYRKQIHDAGMRLNLQLHLFNLWDSGVISAVRIVSCMSLFDEVGNTVEV